MIISWITPDEPGSNRVLYWAENNEELKYQAHGIVLSYKFYNYTSGYIHHCTIKNLEYDSKYYYELGVANKTRQFWFITPPKPGLDVPYTFGLIGDLGQTFDSNITLTHYELNPAKGQTILFVGDLPHADNYPLHDNNRWDTWGKFIERIVAYQPWIWTAGNHELDFVPSMVNRNHLSLTNIDSLFHIEHQEAHPLSGTLSRELRHTSLSCPLTQLMENTPLNINGWKKSYPNSIGMRHHGLLY
ncbi:phosphatase [Lithospermum erythrorhizon]|uniref:Purple acid phosphatase n=1 Tax=Lithospermum erythrorhizon TaxID=34254 RepID=A0AAV3RRB3_LITER